MQYRTLVFRSLAGALLLAAGACADILMAKDKVEIMDPSAVVQRQLDAYNARDLQAFVASYGEDVVLYRAPAVVPSMSGKRELSEFYRTKRFNLPHLHAELVHRAVVGDKVVDHERISGLRDEPVEAVVAYLVRDGLIRSVWLFQAD